MRAEIAIDGADATGANYITWAPVRSTISLVDADGSTGPVEVLLRNQNPDGTGGQIVFRDAIPGEEQDSLRLSLPADGTPVEYFVAGKFGRPSVEDEDAVIEAVQEGAPGGPLSTKALMVRIRKNANTLTEGERDRFLEAFGKLNGGGIGGFSAFRAMHREITQDEAHNFPGFLPWHRAYLLDLERELQQIDPSVALPYWRFDQPAPNLFTEEFIGVAVNGTVRFESGHPLGMWATDGQEGITRRPGFITGGDNAEPATFTFGGNRHLVMNEDDTLLLGRPEHLYPRFVRMEGNPHGAAHVSFTEGFVMDIDTAAKDPLFFLLHANVDRLWAKWQWVRERFDPANPATYGFPPSAVRIGHNLNDTMWPWNENAIPPRPQSAPGGALAASPTTNAPGPTPTVADMIDYQGVINPGNRLGFDYDDVRFEP